MEFSKAIDSITLEGIEPVEIAAGDYVKNGVLHCGKCHGPKQYLIPRGLLKGRLKNIPCPCEAERQEEERQERQRKEERERIGRLRAVAFADPEDSKRRFEADGGGSGAAMKAARNYADKFQQFRKDGKGLLLYGPPGTGKSFAAACIVNALIDKGVPCLFTSLARIVNQLWSSEDKQGFIDGLQQFSLLVLDDYGVERDTEYMTEQVHNIIDARYRSGKPMIVTTNLTGQQLRQANDVDRQRIHSRFFEMCIPVEVAGEDRRQLILKDEYQEYRSILGIS